VTRTPLSRSKGQGHQAALLAAALKHQAAAAVGVGTYSPWYHTAMLPSAGAAVGWTARGASAPAEGGEGQRHIVAAAPPTGYSLFYMSNPADSDWGVLGAVPSAAV